MYTFDLLLYLIGSFSHELLGRHFPDGGNCDHPSHIVVVKVPTCLITQLLQEGVYFKNKSQFGSRHHLIVTVMSEMKKKNNVMLKGIVVLKGRGSFLPWVPAPWRMLVRMQRYPEPSLASHWLHGDRSQWTSSGCKRIKTAFVLLIVKSLKVTQLLSVTKISCVSFCNYELQAQNGNKLWTFFG